MSVLSGLGWIIIALALCGGVFAMAIALFLTPRLRPGADPAPDPLPAVTILKPLSGDEPDLEAALTTFLTQNYAGRVQVVFGIQDAADPAREVVERVQRRFPAFDITIVADSSVYGSNGKISNLINMMRQAKHDVLVLADSDIRVGPDYLRTVVAALARPGIGAVSCFYAGVGLTTVWSRLAAMGITYHFLPNALLGTASGLANPCFGSTIALTRSTLNSIGGFEAFSSFLADDFEIGRAVRTKGLVLAYPPFTVTHGCAERTIGDLVGHELRWARTVRIVNPTGHWGSVVTHPLPLALIGSALLGFSAFSCWSLVLVAAARFSLKLRLDQVMNASAGPLWLLPVRDALSFAVFIASLFGNEVQWRDRRLRVAKNGAMSYR